MENSIQNEHSFNFFKTRSQLLLSGAKRMVHYRIVQSKRTAFSSFRTLNIPTVVCMCAKLMTITNWPKRKLLSPLEVRIMLFILCFEVKKKILVFNCLKSKFVWEIKPKKRWISIIFVQTKAFSEEFKELVRKGFISNN